jgi:hypothetical protein
VNLQAVLSGAWTDRRRETKKHVGVIAAKISVDVIITDRPDAARERPQRGPHDSEHSHDEQLNHFSTPFLGVQPDHYHVLLQEPRTVAPSVWSSLLSWVEGGLGAGVAGGPYPAAVWGRPSATMLVEEASALTATLDAPFVTRPGCSWR